MSLLNQKYQKKTRVSQKSTWHVRTSGSSFGYVGKKWAILLSSHAKCAEIRKKDVLQKNGPEGYHLLIFPLQYQNTGMTNILESKKGVPAQHQPNITPGRT